MYMFLVLQETGSPRGNLHKRRVVSQNDCSHFTRQVMFNHTAKKCLETLENLRMFKNVMPYNLFYTLLDWTTCASTCMTFVLGGSVHTLMHLSKHKEGKDICKSFIHFYRQLSVYRRQKKPTRGLCTNYTCSPKRCTANQKPTRHRVNAWKNNQ